MFTLGSVGITPMALEILGESGARTLLLSHVSGSWGDLEEEDIEANKIAIKQGLRVFSKYNVMDNSFYVITEADRSYTTIMLSEEY